MRSFLQPFIELPPWARMWLLAGAIFYVCKWLTWRRYLAEGGTVRLGRGLGYFLAWPGMDAAAFCEGRRPVTRPTVREWTTAIAKTGFGVTLLWIAVPIRIDSEPLLAGWIGMIGLVTALHFGLFHLLALAWRSAGVDVEPIMDRPLAATSLADFWGRRWNRAFNRLADQFVFRPLSRRLGPNGAFAASFLASGLVHDVVISVPAGAGFGRPTLYFVLQAIAVFASRSTVGRQLGLHRGLRARLTAGVALSAPLGLLFPRPFVETVIVPFLKVIQFKN